MNNIVIIEDNFEHFQIISKLVAGCDNDVFPKNITSGQELSDFLTPVRAMIETSDANQRANKKNEFFASAHLKQGCDPIQISLYIIDYQLLTESKNINGLKFCEYIEEIREGEIPVILLTILDLNDTDVNAEKVKFENEYPNSKISFERKVQNKTGKKISNWDKGGKSIEEIVDNSSELGDRLKAIIKRLCPPSPEGISDGVGNSDGPGDVYNAGETVNGGDKNNRGEQKKPDIEEVY